MCVAVYDEQGNRYGSIGALRAAGFVVERDDWYDEEYQREEPAPNVCLCGVDIDAIVERSGVPFRVDRDLGDVIVTALPVYPYRTQG